MRVNVIIPTYNRLESLKRAVKSISESDYDDVCISIIVDGNRGMFTKILAEPANIILNEKRMDWVLSMNRALREMEDTDAVLYAADDLEFPPYAIPEAVEAMKEHFPDGDGLVGLNQNCAGIDSAFGLMGRKFIERFPERQVFCPDYVHFVGDAELGAFAKSIGKFYFCSGVTLKHERNQQDETFRLGMAMWGRDLAMNLKRQVYRLLWGSNFGLAGNGQ